METSIPLHKKEYIRHIITEHLIYESFLKTIKDFAKDVDVDDESVESDIEVKTEVPGEDADTSAVLGLLTKAQEEASGMGDEVLMDQIGNTITYFTRKHVVKSGN